MFREADENSDGRINFDEYRTLMLKHPSVLRQMKERNQEMTPDQLAALGLVSGFDENGQPILTPEQQAAALAAAAAAASSSGTPAGAYQGGGGASAAAEQQALQMTPEQIAYLQQQMMQQQQLLMNQQMMVGQGQSQQGNMIEMNYTQDTHG